MGGIRRLMRCCCLFVLAAPSLTTSHTQTRRARATGGPPPCPCDDPGLCRPLSPQPSAEQDEVVAFSSWVFNGEQPQHNYTAPQHFRWNKITAWAPFEVDETGPGGDQYAEMFCTAHKHGARVLSWSPLPQGNTTPGSGGQPVTHRGCGVTEFYGWARARNGHPKNLEMFNQTLVRQWAQETAECIPARGFDGVLLDQEAIDLDFNQTEKDAITFAICSLKKALNETLPGNMVAWTSDVGAYFDYAALTAEGCVDLWLDMAYSWCTSYEAHSATRNRAPTPLPFIEEIIQTYESTFKVPRDKLGVIFPWYACAFECAGEGDAYGGCPTTPSAAKSDFLPIYSNIPMHYLPNATGKRWINTSSLTNVVNYRNASGGQNQLWFDDPATYAKKYEKVKSSGLRALGMWTADSAGSDEQIVAGMWDAVPGPR